jgi:hypothetical protein
MEIHALAHYTNQPVAEIERLLALPTAAIFDDPGYVAMLQSLDIDLLEATLPVARSIYSDLLPEFKTTLGNDMNINLEPMSPYTLGNWLVGVARFPHTANQIIRMHESVPGNVVAAGLTHLVVMLDGMEDGREMWQRALVTLSLPLMTM